MRRVMMLQVEWWWGVFFFRCGFRECTCGFRKFFLKDGLSFVRKFCILRVELGMNKKANADVAVRWRIVDLMNSLVK